MLEYDPQYSSLPSAVHAIDSIRPVTDFSMLLALVLDLVGLTSTMFIFYSSISERCESLYQPTISILGSAAIDSTPECLLCRHFFSRLSYRLAPVLTEPRVAPVCRRCEP